MAIASNFPVIKPSLSLDFANTKRLDSRVTFTRTTTATYYDGVTTAMAEQNLFIQSQTFDVSGWTLARASITANTSVAPDGTTTAETLTADGTSGTHLIQSDDSLTPAGQTRTISVFAKAGTNNFIQLAFGADAAPYANFDLSGGTVGNSASVTASIVSVGSGWYRCIVTATSSTASGARFFIITNGTSVRGESNSLNTTVLIWGAQMEYRSSVSSYTATTTQAITNYIPVLLTAASGVARFDHNPTTDESLGLLIEEARTNLLTYSADFSNAAWTKADSSITSNTIVSPDGLLAGDKLVENTTSNSHYIISSTTAMTSGVTYTGSVFAKAAERSVLQLTYQGATHGSTYYANFNLANGTLGSSGGSGVVAAITSVGNGWYRCSISAPATTTASGGLVILPLTSTTAGRLQTYTGDGYSGLFLWGAQLEAGAFPTSYIATTSATATRNADIATMTGSNFTSWYNASEGAIYCESQTASFPQNQGIWAIGIPSLSFGSGNMMYVLYDSGLSGRITANSYTNGSQQVNLGVIVSQTANTFSKSAYVYKVNDFAQTTNAASVFTDTSGTVPIGPTGLSIGGLSQGWIGGANVYLNGTIKKIAYYPLRVTNAQLQALTS